MKKTISRTIPVTHIHAAKLEEVDGELKILDLNETRAGNLNKEEAEKVLVKQYGAGVTVKEVTVDVSLYEMELDQFIALAEKKEAAEELAE